MINSNKMVTCKDFVELRGLNTSVQNAYSRNGRRRSPIKGGKDSKLPSIGMTLIEIIKINMLRVNPRKNTPWEKRGRPPIQCWGFKEDHMYKDFPHKKDRVKTVHNV
jgi:hypothetical protein